MFWHDLHLVSTVSSAYNYLNLTNLTSETVPFNVLGIEGFNVLGFQHNLFLNLDGEFDVAEATIAIKSFKIS